MSCGHRKKRRHTMNLGFTNKALEKTFKHVRSIKKQQQLERLVHQRKNSPPNTVDGTEYLVSISPLQFSGVNQPSQTFRNMPFLGIICCWRTESSGGTVFSTDSLNPIACSHFFVWDNQENRHVVEACRRGGMVWYTGVTNIAVSLAHVLFIHGSKEVTKYIPRRTIITASDRFSYRSIHIHAENNPRESPIKVKKSHHHA